MAGMRSIHAPLTSLGADEWACEPGSLAYFEVQLVQEVFELGEVDGFGEMMVETSFFRPALVLVLTPAGQSDQ